MKANLIHRNKCGIYAIFNRSNGKVYIGKAINIHRRIKNHVGFLNMKSKKAENQHLINSWHKYGRNQFSYVVLEYCSTDNLAERELFFMKLFQSTNRAYGYSATGMICSDETKQKMRISRTFRDERFPNIRKDIGAKSSKFWRENPDIKEEMAVKVSNRIRVYKIAQLNYNTLEILQIFDTRRDLKQAYPDYYHQAILGCCQGNKNSYKGFKWCYLDRYTNEKITKK